MQVGPISGLPMVLPTHIAILISIGAEPLVRANHRQSRTPNYSISNLLCMWLFLLRASL
ncbi:hypothetical protein FB559_2122 [Actinoallomurus bryophytorum]|uniref:Uncharacterized protein n=1 Tax=Actinoallomurus bryophytorum TaxID=1490222 RepID=A0A543CHK5_9ACTN|nr:hypothetical protein FB559_2122 [Actinoallomurus bryophytorum]